MKKRQQRLSRDLFNCSLLPLHEMSASKALNVVKTVSTIAILTAYVIDSVQILSSVYIVYIYCIYWHTATVWTPWPQYQDAISIRSWRGLHSQDVFLKVKCRWIRLLKRRTLCLIYECDLVTLSAIYFKVVIILQSLETWRYWTNIRRVSRRFVSKKDVNLTAVR